MEAPGEQLEWRKHPNCRFFLFPFLMVQPYVGTVAMVAIADMFVFTFLIVLLADVSFFEAIAS